MHEHVNDPYVKEAHAAGLPLARRVQAARARREGQAAPPGDERRRPRRGAGQLDARCCANASGRDASIVAIDLLPMEPVPGVHVRPGRLSRRRGPGRRRSRRSASARVDLVVSDMAPNLSGIEAADQARSVHLGELALEFARRTGCNPAAISSSKCSRAKGSTRSSARWRSISPRFTSASRKRRATAAARSSRRQRTRDRDVRRPTGLVAEGRRAAGMKLAVFAAKG